MENWSSTRALLVTFVLLSSGFVDCATQKYTFNVVSTNMTRLCSRKTVVSINGKVPGPILYAREDDNVLVRVNNHVPNNISIHWHGVRQLRTGWSDGPAYVTQCPIQSGQSFLYNFTLTGQRGTLLWHAHISWLRATVYGAIVILPKKGVAYPFPKPDGEKVIVLGEWWKVDVEEVVNQSTATGMPPNISDSHTINGHPGPVSGCPTPGMGLCIISIFHISRTGYSLHVESGKTYLLRIVNAAVNDELFLKIAGHKFTVVEADATYTKPFTTDTIFLGPGQTTNALLTADQTAGKYIIAVSPFMDTVVAVDNITAVGFLRYKGIPPYSPPYLTATPAINATTVTSSFSSGLKSLNSNEFPAAVPQTVDHSLFFAIGVGINACPTCVNGSRAVADINNVSFVLPSVALLQAHYFGVQGVFTDDFPANPPSPFNYTGVSSPGSLQTRNGTKVYRLGFNATVQVVLQGTSVVAPESHPIHLHGFNFFVVGKGIGNFDKDKDTSSFNLVDPVERNTMSVPTAGWAAIRFRADNPGVWFMHCHLEVHTTWGLKMAFVVDNGKGPNQSIIPPPSDLPQC
ncbi:IRX12 [Linum perenne]